MAKTRFVALLRGINVGGNNSIKMADLKSCLEGMGLENVVTYIQSGNVLFETSGKNREKLEAEIERVLSKRFNYAARLVLVSDKEWCEAVEKAPKGFGSKPEAYRYDVIFLKRPMTPKAAMKDLSLKEGVDQAWAGKHALYFARLTKKATQSRLSRIVQTPSYKYMTIRNWNTTTKLLGMIEFV